MMRKFTATAAFCLVLFLAHHSDAATVPLLEPTMIETETAQTTESVLRSDVDAETETEGSGFSLDEEESDLSLNEKSDTTESPENERDNDDNVTVSSTNIKSDKEEDDNVTVSSTNVKSDKEEDDNATVRSTNIESDKEEDIDISINLIREEEEEEEITSEKAPEEIQARSSSKNTDDEELVTSRNAEADKDVDVVTADSRADEDIVTESSRAADEESTQVPATEIVETSSPFKAFFKLNITITSCGGNVSEFSNVNQTLTLDELMNELNVTSEEIETTFEEIGDTLTEAVNQTMEAFGSLFSGMLDVISSPMPEIRPLISVNTREGAGPFNIPGIFSVNTNRKDGSLMAIEEGENTRVRIPGILHLKVGEDTIEGKNSVDTTFSDSEHLIHVKAEAGSAHIKAPYMDLKFGNIANKKANKVTLY